MHTYIISAFLLYFSLLLILGLIFHKKQATSSDFIMGNRSLNFWLVALSAHASDMSAWLFMVFPMMIFVSGLPQIWVAVGLICGMYLNWQFVAPKLRTLTEQYDSLTLPSFFEKRYNDRSNVLRLLSAISMIIFLTFYLCAELIAMGFLLESIFGMNYYIGLSISLIVVVIYTSIGGFTTVAWTDLFQALFLLSVIIAVPIIAFYKMSGWNQIVEAATAQGIPLTFNGNMRLEEYIGLFLTCVGWGIGYFGMPHIITKFMGIKNVSEMNKSKWIGMTWQMIALGAAAVIGLISIGYFANGIENSEMVFVEMVKDLFHPFVAGFILCGIIAANMSTMDSQILVCSSIVSEDLYPFFFKKSSTDKKILWVSKLSVIFISMTALLIAFNKSLTVADTVLYAWSGLGSAFGPLVLMSLYSKKTNRYGAIAGILVGTLTVMVWPTLNPFLLALTLPPMIPGFFLSLLSIYLVSACTANNHAVCIHQDKI